MLTRRGFPTGLPLNHTTAPAGQRLKETMSYSIATLTVDEDTIGFAILAEDVLFNVKFASSGEALASLSIYRRDLTLTTDADEAMCEARRRALLLPVCPNCTDKFERGRIVNDRCNLCNQQPIED